MADEAHTLGFGLTYDMVAARTACGQLLTLSAHRRDVSIPPHRHVNDYVCIVLTGGFAEKENNVWRERKRGNFFTHHAGETHHDCFGPSGAMCVNLHFAAGEQGPAVDGTCSAAATVAAQRLAFELAASSREELVIASLAAEISGELQPAAKRVSDGGKWIGLVLEAISDEPDRRWTLRELAEIADRRPVHVAQGFSRRERHFARRVPAVEAPDPPQPRASRREHSAGHARGRARLLRPVAHERRVPRLVRS